jgi:hypothetical protein
VWHVVQCNELHFMLMLAGLLSSSVGMLVWFNDDAGLHSCGAQMLINLLRELLHVEQAVGFGASLLPLLQQVHRCCRELHTQLPAAAAAAAAAAAELPPAGADSCRQLQETDLHDIGQLLLLQHDLIWQ